MKLPTQIICGILLCASLLDARAAQPLDDGFLARRGVGKTVQALLPDFLDRAVGPQARDKFVGRRPQPEIEWAA